MLATGQIFILLSDDALEIQELFIVLNINSSRISCLFWDNSIRYVFIGSDFDMSIKSFCKIGCKCLNQE